MNREKSVKHCIWDQLVMLLSYVTWMLRYDAAHLPFQCTTHDLYVNVTCIMMSTLFEKYVFLGRSIVRKAGFTIWDFFKCHNKFLVGEDVVVMVFIFRVRWICHCRFVIWRTATRSYSCFWTCLNASPLIRGKQNYM